MFVSLESLKNSDKSPQYYQYYPRLFSTYYTDIEESVINALCDAGYIYYHSLLLIDSVVDKKDFSNLLDILMYQEEAIKILSAIYGKDSEFWKYWNNRK